MLEKSLYYCSSGTTMPNMSTKYYISSTQMKFAVSGREILLRVVLLLSFACMGLLSSLWQSLLLPDFFWFSMLIFIILHHLVRYGCQCNYWVVYHLIRELLAALIWRVNMALLMFLPSSLKSQVCYNFFMPELT